jgi:hypothetical protein
MKINTKPGEEWLSSDAKILERIVTTPTTDGKMHVSLGMPSGEPVEAILEKMNVGAANSFCQYVREEYNARQESQRVASAKRHAELAEERATEQEAVEESLSVSEASVQVDFMDPEAVAAECVRLAGRLAELRDEAKDIDRTLTTLYKILGVLNENAPEVPDEAVHSVSPAEDSGDTQPVDQETCPQESVQGRPSDPESVSGPQTIEEQLDGPEEVGESV